MQVHIYTYIFIQVNLFMIVRYMQSLLSVPLIRVNKHTNFPYYLINNPEN